MNNHKLQSYISAFALALMISSQYITLLLGLYSKSNFGYFSVVLSSVVIFLLLYVIFKPLRRISAKFIGIGILILLFFLLTVLFQSDKSNLSIIDFIGMCLLPFVCGAILEPDYKQVLKIIMYMILAAVPIYDLIFSKGNIGVAYDAISMYESYALLPVVCAGLIHYMVYREESSRLDKIIYFINFVFVLLFIKMSYRGPLLAILITLASIFYFSDLNRRNNKKLYIYSFLLLFVSITSLFYIREIATCVNSIISSIGYNIAFIDKMIYLSSEEGIDHGRFAIWEIAIDRICESPFWGHGLATFKYYTGYIFPHNFLLQFLFDGGLFLTVPIIYCLCSEIKKIFKYKRYKYDKFIFTIFVASIGITRAAISAEVWRIIPFWTLMGILTIADNYIAKGNDKWNKQV